eukprot:10099779-Prorocentrum_lima.AAC.1
MERQRQAMLQQQYWQTQGLMQQQMQQQQMEQQQTQQQQCAMPHQSMQQQPSSPASWAPRAQHVPFQVTMMHPHYGSPYGPMFAHQCGDHPMQDATASAAPI